MKVIKRINKGKTYTAKDGNVYTSINYYIALDNGRWVAIRPAFNTDRILLDAVAEKVVNNYEDEE